MHDSMRLGQATVDMSAEVAAATLLQPLMTGPFVRRGVQVVTTPVSVAWALGFPLRSPPTGSFPPLCWRVPPSSFVLIAMTAPSAL